MEKIRLSHPIDNKADLVDTLKLIMFKKYPYIFDSIDFDSEDDLFFNPLLFAFLNQDKKSEVDQLHRIITKEKEYYGDEKLLLNESFYVIKDTLQILKPFFFEFYRGEITNPNPSYHSTWSTFYEHAEKGLRVLEKFVPGFYSELIFANNTLFFHDNIKIINFVTKRTQGLLYFNTLPENDEIYFIEEFIHQGSHNFLNLLLHDKETWFLDIAALEKPMSELTGKKGDYRSFFSMFHGLYTVTKRIDCFHVLLKANYFKGKQKHELLGRMTDQYQRFYKGGYNTKIDLKKICTPKGLELYNFLFETGKNILEDYHHLPKKFDLSNRDVDFRYKDFCKLNPIEDCSEILNV